MACRSRGGAFRVSKRPSGPGLATSTYAQGADELMGFRFSGRFFSIRFGLARARPSGVGFGRNCLMTANRESCRSFTLRPQLIVHRN
jgi:hypothetical protein